MSSVGKQAAPISARRSKAPGAGFATIRSGMRSEGPVAVAAEVGKSVSCESNHASPVGAGLQVPEPTAASAW